MLAWESHTVTSLKVHIFISMGRYFFISLETYTFKLVLVAALKVDLVR